MRTQTKPLFGIRFRSLLLAGALIAIAALAAIPSRSVLSRSRVNTRQNSVADTLKPTVKPSYPSTLMAPGFSSLLNAPVSGETIAVYAADCVTPKDSFNLGEVVCTKTNGVDLSSPGNYYVDWFGPNGMVTGPTITQNPQTFLFALPTGNTDKGSWKANIGRVSPAETSIIGNPPIFSVGNGPAIAIYRSDCTTPNSVFNVSDTNPNNLIVCAKVTGGDPSQHILWSNSRFELVQDVPLGTGQNSFTLTTGSSLGDWRVILFEPFSGSVYAVTPFTVTDTGSPSADIVVDKGTFQNSVAAGSQAVFTVQVTNLGPDAATVQLLDSIPANTTFDDFAPTAAPQGTNCAKPPGGAASGDVNCTIPLGRGETAVFLATYNVLSGTAPNTLITNTSSVSVASPITDPSSANDSSTASILVSGTSSNSCTLTCPANVVVTANTSQAGQPGAFVSYGAASSDGDCGAISNNPASGSFFAVGTHSIVSSSELGGGSCTFTVTVLDTNPPTIMCPANVTVTAATGADSATVNPGTPSVNASGGGTITGVRSDNVPATLDENGNVVNPAVIHDVYNDPYPLGTTGIHWTVTDAGGRKASCDQTVTVLANNRPPVSISCPANVSVTAPDGSCEATVSSATIGTPTTNPSDGDVHVVAVRSDGRALTDPFPAGTTLITWTATDEQTERVASCTQTVTVTAGQGHDTTPPVLTVPPNVSVTTSSCTVLLDDELGTAQATDNNACGGTVTVTRTGVPAGSIFPTGTTTIVYTATDPSGNTTTGVQLVIVTESPAVPPTIMAPPNVSRNTGSSATSCGIVISNAELGTATASDNCPGVTVTRTGVPAGNFFPVGDTFINYTATDRSGNTAMATQKVTVTDTTPPLITAPANVAAATGPGATTCDTIVSDTTLGTATATDNCGTVTITRSPSGNTFPVGTTTIVWTATDGVGNTSTASQTVTVVDDTVPVITTNGQTLSMWPPNHQYQTFQVTNFVTGASDNCGGVSLNDVVIEKVTSDEIENGNGDGNTTNDIVIASDCKSLQLRAEREGNSDGRVYTITFKVTDASGNVGRVTANVVVVHNPGETPVDSGVHYTVNGSCP